MNTDTTPLSSPPRLHHHQLERIDKNRSASARHFAVCGGGVSDGEQSHTSRSYWSQHLQLLVTTSAAAGHNINKYQDNISFMCGHHDSLGPAAAGGIAYRRRCSAGFIKCLPTAPVRVDSEALSVGRRSVVLDFNRRECTTNENCMQGETWKPPYPQCIGHTCKCAENTCLAKVQFSIDETFYCGECGSFGSICNTTVDCSAIESTCKDSFCACTRGTSSYGICNVVLTDTSASPTNLVLIGVLLFIIIFNRCITSSSMYMMKKASVKRSLGGLLLLHTSNHWLDRESSLIECNRGSIRRRYRRLTRRCCSNNHEDQAICHIDEDGTHHNPRGNNKSPSYVLGNHEFYASSDDPDLDWAIELSLLEMMRRSSVSNSVRSAASNRQQPSDIHADEEPPLRSDVHENINDNLADNTTCMSKNDINLQIVISHRDDTEATCCDNNNHNINNDNVAGTSDNKATEATEKKNSTNFPDVVISLKADGSELSEADSKNTASHLTSNAFDSVAERKTNSLNNDGDGGSDERLSREADVTSVYRRCPPAV
ncbi:Ubiquitin interacting motif [Trinorchestia longiramus]|nr:Ubiquitin interacting motif [Trinorchestia longiramus]